MIKCDYCGAEVTQTLTKPYEAYTVMIAHQNTHLIKTPSHGNLSKLDKTTTRKESTILKYRNVQSQISDNLNMIDQIAESKLTSLEDKFNVGNGLKQIEADVSDLCSTSIPFTKL